MQALLVCSSADNIVYSIVYNVVEGEGNVGSNGLNEYSFKGVRQPLAWSLAIPVGCLLCRGKTGWFGFCYSCISLSEKRVKRR